MVSGSSQRGWFLIVLFCMRNPDLVPDKCQMPDWFPSGQEEDHLAPINLRFTCQPTALEIQVVEKPRPGVTWNTSPESPCLDAKFFIPHLPRKQKAFFFAHSACIHTLNTLSLQAAPRAEFSTTPKVLACEPSDLRVLQEAPYIRCLLITWRPSQGPRDGPGCAWGSECKSQLD